LDRETVNVAAPEDFYMPNTTTNFISHGHSIGAEIFAPSGTPNGGAIVLAYGSDGLVDNAHGPWATMMREYAADLADLGFTAAIPDYFQRTGTRPGDIDFENGGAQQIWLHRDDWQTTLVDALTFTQGLPGTDPARTGLLGFSLGGHLCLRIAAKAKALVEFFAPLLDSIGPATPRLAAQIHHGAADTLVSFAGNADKIDQQLRATGASTEVFGYEGAGHGFAGADAANSEARSLSKARTLKFFAAHL
jgi:carboxymethylenebutenolidase